MKLFNVIALVFAIIFSISLPSFAEHSACEKKIRETEQRAELAEKRAEEAEKRAEMVEHRMGKAEDNQSATSNKKDTKKRRVGDEGFSL